MMNTQFYYHPVFLDHDTGPYHPECADRLRAVLAALETEEFSFLDRVEAPEASLEQISRIHPLSYVEHVRSVIPAQGHHALDADTVVAPASWEAALRAAGAVCAAVDAVAQGRARNAFCAVRPPGHHAEIRHAMGFCIFNNVAVGAMQARAMHGLSRVGVIDFDVHHGNGTQHAFENDPALFYASTHQSPLYPGTGTIEERGVAGNIVNVPLEAGAGSAEFRHALADIILPQLKAFKPDMILISAGFDAHRADPLANLRFSTEDFAWATSAILKLAGECCGHKVVSVLEGGYDLEALAAASAAHIRALMET